MKFFLKYNKYKYNNDIINGIQNNITMASRALLICLYYIIRIICNMIPTGADTNLNSVFIDFFFLTSAPHNNKSFVLYCNSQK